MPFYPQYRSDIQAAATVYRQTPPAAYAYEYLGNLAEALQELARAPRMLTASNRAALTQKVLENYYFAKDFKKLNEGRIFIQSVFDALLANLDFSSELTTGFLTLQQAGILNVPGNIEALSQNPRLAPELARGFAALQQAKIFDPFTRSFLLQHPQILPSLLLLAKNRILDQTRFIALCNCLPYLKGLNEVFAELDQEGSLNKDSYAAVMKIAPQAGKLSPLLSQLRQVGRLKANFAAALQQVEHSQALTNGIFNFNYGQVQPKQEDLELLFKFAPEAEPLSLVMIYLSHSNLLKTYRPVLAEQGRQAGKLLKLIEKLQQNGLFKPDNIAAVFKQIQSLDKLQQACEAQATLTQPQFSELVGRTQAERRLALPLKSLGLLTGAATGSQFFTLRTKPVKVAAVKEAKGFELKA